ncbi:MAG: sce7726 family protein [Lachnospiraceae bacterium]|nr:sce7726 family protein [Lachnospiraceae bacterium]
MLYDKDIREPLFFFLEESYGKVRILEEKNVGGSRADVVMVRENMICGVEIKSDADSYVRLAGQVADYDEFFDRNYLVVGSSHAMSAAEHVPEYWGLISVEEDGDKADFYVIREASDNPNRDIKKKLGFLWRPELADIQTMNFMPKYAQLSKKAVIDKIAEKVPEGLLHAQISEELFERDYNRILDKINEYRTEKGLKKKRKRSYRRRAGRKG